MKKSILISVLMLGTALCAADQEKGTDVIGGVCAFINEFRHPHDYQASGDLRRFKLANISFRCLEPTEHLKEMFANDLALALKIELHRCKSFQGKQPSERPNSCNHAILLRLVAEKQLTKVEQGRWVNDYVTTSVKMLKKYSELANALGKGTTREDFEQRNKNFDFWMGWISEEEFLKS